jgi:AcrR family transcriptional regulator
VVRPGGASAPRDRLLETAAALFYADGIHGVGVDRILSEAGVTRATLYRHFDGKDALVEAYLDGEDTALRGVVGAAVASGGTPAEVLEAIIDEIATDARRRHRRGCPFVNAAAEYPDPDSGVRRIVERHRTWLRAAMTTACRSAGLARPAQVAGSLVLLRDAALVGVALDGDAAITAFRRTARQLAGLDT